VPKSASNRQKPSGSAVAGNAKTLVCVRPSGPHRPRKLLRHARGHAAGKILTTFATDLVVSSRGVLLGVRRAAIALETAGRPSSVYKIGKVLLFNTA